MSGGTVSPETEKKDILHVKKDAGREFHYHYNREERLAQRQPVSKAEAGKRRRYLKFGKLLYIVLAAAIILLVFLFIYRFFFS
jgi:hypothetical protein